MRTFLGRRGFTLVEIMIVMIIVDLLVSMAIAAVKHARETTQNKPRVNDFHHLAYAFERYSLETGQFLDAVARGIIPANMTDSLRSMAFARYDIHRWQLGLG